jgi:hypothetical protein
MGAMIEPEALPRRDRRRRPRQRGSLVFGDGFEWHDTGARSITAGI